MASSMYLIDSMIELFISVKGNDTILSEQENDVRVDS
jgi:hypothetical protein